MTTDSSELKPVAKRLFRFVKPHRTGLALTLIVYALAAATEPLIPQLIKTVFGQGFDSDAFSVWWVPVVLIGLFALRGLLGFLGQYLLNWSLTRIVLDLRSTLLEALLKADARVFTSLQPGTAVTKVVNDPQQVMSMLTSPFLSVLRDGLPALAILVYLLMLNWQLTLLSMITTPVLAFVMRKVSARVRRLGSIAYDAQLQLVNKVDDLTRAWRVVRSFDAGEHERNQFNALARQVQRNNLKSAAAAAMTQPLSQFVASWGLSLIVCLALLQARQANTGVGEFAAFVTGLLLLTSRLRHLSDLMPPITSALVIARGCLGLLDMPAEPDTGTRELKDCKGEILMQDVRLRYPDAEKPARLGCREKLHRPSAAGLRPSRLGFDQAR
jgi:subfamily B ATP-binding cassette protein MsbA